MDNDLLQRSVKANTAERVTELERREEGARAKGDFEGSVTGYWQRLDQTGVGKVLYKGKTYSVKPIGFLSVPKGTEVELSHANGIYYAKF